MVGDAVCDDVCAYLFMKIIGKMHIYSPPKLAKYDDIHYLVTKVVITIITPS